MKKRLIILAVILVLLLSGCDLRNRRPSSDFIPATNAPRPTSPKQETEATEPEQEIKELTRHSVRTVLSESETYVDIYGNEWTYSFRLPFVDFPTREASQCNNEIDRLFRREISGQKTLAETGQPLTIPTIEYACYYTGTLITVNVWKEETTGDITRSVYCFRPSGTMATSGEILDAVWMDPDEFMIKLQELVEKRYKKDNKGSEDEVTYERYYERTMEMIEDVEDVTLYADEEDKVYALVKIYDAFGGLSQIELKVEP